MLTVTSMVPRLRILVVDDFAGGVGEFAAPDRQSAHVIRREARIGVLRIEHVGDRCGESALALPERGDVTPKQYGSLRGSLKRLWV